MNATCGTCGRKHDTILEYRECAGASAEAASAQLVLDGMDPNEGRVYNPPSEKQIKYVQDLLSDREWPDEYTPESLRSMERRQVSKLIEALQSAPERASEGDHGYDSIPIGRYALRKANGDGWSFWEVQRSISGRTFIKLLVGSPGDYRKERVPRTLAHNALSEIERVTPRQASINFGKESETCGVCHSPLTNNESIAYGIGPHCRSKMGW